MTAAAADQAWIQNSLARLETLEAQRQQLAATGQTDKLAELDEEIHSLYEVLESVAGEDESAATPANMAAPAVAAAPVAAVPMGQPMNQPTAQAGMAAPMNQPMGQPMAPPMDASTGYDDLDDIKPPRSPLPFILAGLLVVGGGVGAFVMMNGEKAPEASPEPTGPATVIKAGAIVEDTQEPQVAKGADADRTRGTNFKEGSSTRSRPRRSGSSGSRSRPSRGKKDGDGRKIKLEKTNDPLAGVD